MTIGSEDNNRMYYLESQPKGGILSEIEIEILQFVNEFGFCEIKQIIKRFCMKRSAAYLNMQVLIRLGFSDSSSILFKAGVGSSSRYLNKLPVLGVLANFFS